jgi:hypothetical protein
MDGHGLALKLPQICPTNLPRKLEHTLAYVSILPTSFAQVRHHSPYPVEPAVRCQWQSREAVMKLSRRSLLSQHQLDHREQTMEQVVHMIHIDDWSLADFGMPDQVAVSYGC